MVQCNLYSKIIKRYYFPLIDYSQNIAIQIIVVQNNGDQMYIGLHIQCQMYLYDKQYFQILIDLPTHRFNYNNIYCREIQLCTSMSMYLSINNKSCKTFSKLTQVINNIIYIYIKHTLNQMLMWGCLQDRFIFIYRYYYSYSICSLTFHSET